MRCLHCRQDGITSDDLVCPNPECAIYLPLLLRDMLVPGTSLRNGTYLIDYALGRGGFGITYRAYHVLMQVHVAIKEFFPQEHALRESPSGHLSVPTMQQGNYQRALERFLVEGRILFNLNHPNVVRVYDSFREMNTAYIVMELLGGCTLRDKMESMPDKRLPPDQVKVIVDKLVEALDAVHNMGIYHLDISPDNVQLKTAEQVVLMDFGAARYRLTSSTTRAFKLDYAAPEVMSGKDVGPESDLFELAMMIHEMLTGIRPPSALERVDDDAWDSKMVDEPWRSLLSHALQLKRDARPASVREWWKGYRPPRGGLVLPPPRPPRRKPFLVLPARRRGLALKDKSRSKPSPPMLKLGRHTPSPPAARASIPVNEARLSPQPVGRRGVNALLKFLMYIFISCILGLSAFFIVFEITKPDEPKLSPSTQMSNAEPKLSDDQQKEYEDQYRTATIAGISSFCVVSLGTFFLVTVRLWKRKPTG